MNQNNRFEYDCDAYHRKCILLCPSCDWEYRNCSNCVNAPPNDICSCCLQMVEILSFSLQKSSVFDNIFENGFFKFFSLDDFLDSLFGPFFYLS